jgi:4-hydroxybenzoate polyprenyltransferase/phosphoserine phosphatase
VPTAAALPEPQSLTSAAARPVLCVDLDGTLIATDVLAESVAQLLARNPFWAFALLFWLLRGRAYLKQAVAARTTFDAAALPYRPEIVAFLEGERAAGRRLVLATAAHRSVAEAVAAHLGLFAEVVATDAGANLKGARKAAALVAKFGEKGFTYAGDTAVDLEVWAHAAGAVVVGPAALESRAAKVTSLERAFVVPAAGLRAWRKALRLHQWLKNLLVFVPAFTAHRLAEPGILPRTLLAFAAFSLCASSVYVANDLADLQADRAHRTKRLRPFAAGTLSIFAGLAAVPILVAASLALSLLVSVQFTAILALYLATTTAYTFRLKRLALVDVLCLAGLYVVRLFAGASAADVPISPWLFAFALFMFLSLALLKRVAELRLSEPGEQRVAGRGYAPGDLDLLRQMGISSGYLAVLVFALYVQSATVASLYRRPELLWLLCPMLLYWVSRAWLLTHRGEMHDDPVVFAARDRVSLVIGALAAVVVVLAT